MTNSSQILYTSGKIHQTIKRIFGTPDSSDRRVALVAYVGRGAEAFLPHPKGLLLVCNPDPAATSPQALRSLMRREAVVQFSNRLHMKIYWSKNRGCIITSANASKNALGRNSLKEAGVYLPRGTVDIDRLIKEAAPFEITERLMDRLEHGSRQHQAFMLGRKRFKRKQVGGVSFKSWHESRYRAKWKIFAWEDMIGVAGAAKEKTEMEYGRPQPSGWANCARGTISSGDWLLCFRPRVHGSGIKNLEWMYVDFVVPVKRTDRRAYEQDFPYQAIQVHDMTHYPVPPFAITNRTRRAFSAATAEFGYEKLKDVVSLRPPARWLREAYQSW